MAATQLVCCALVCIAVGRSVAQYEIGSWLMAAAQLVCCAAQLVLVFSCKIPSCSKLDLVGKCYLQVAYRTALAASSSS